MDLFPRYLGVIGEMHDFVVSKATAWKTLHRVTGIFRRYLDLGHVGMFTLTTLVSGRPNRSSRSRLRH